MQKLNTLKKMVINVLEKSEKSRNSDQYLTILIWKTYYPDKIIEVRKNDEIKNAIFLKDIMELPREDNVKRIRAALNAKGLYLPTSEKVAMQRKLNMDAWREFINREAVS